MAVVSAGNPGSIAVALLLVRLLIPASAQADLATPSTKPSPSHQLERKPVQLGAIAFGSGPLEIEAGECTAGEEGCVLGFAFTDLDSLLYSYDFERNDIKAFQLDRKGLIGRAVLPRLPVMSKLEQPCDGAVGRDGTIYLVTDSTQPRDRLHVYALGPGEQTWSGSSAFDLSPNRRPLTQAGGPALATVGGIRLRVSPDGAVTVTDMASESRPEAITRTATKDVLHGPAHDSSSGYSRDGFAHTLRAPDGSTVRLPFRIARYLGVDERGQHYFLVLDDETSTRLQCFAPTGQLVADGPYPGLHLVRSLLGKGYLFLQGSGRVLILEPGSHQLRLWSWSPRQ